MNYYLRVNLWVLTLVIVALVNAADSIDWDQPITNQAVWTLAKAVLSTAAVAYGALLNVTTPPKE